MAPKGKGKKGKRGDDDWPSDDDKVSAASQRLRLLFLSHDLRLARFACACVCRAR